MAKGIFGERLKRERDLREVSIDELTKATRISRRFLEALENEDWEKLPGGVFGHGFVRAIARYLGLDEEGLLGEYDLARAENALSPAPPRPEERIPAPPKWLPAAAVLIVLLLLVGLFYAGRYGWRRFAKYRAAERSSASSTGSQSSLESDSPAPSVSSNSSSVTLDLSISTSSSTRVRVLSDGKLVLDDELPAGETRRFSANEQFEVTAADSSAVLLEMNGKAMPPVGAPGTSGKMVLTRDDLR